ncbi:hypothetical protein LZ023_00335 [Pseudomonas silvicola]|nr:hypothetical protein LZ023_00335 [Pseudomonas silvicola]
MRINEVGWLFCMGAQALMQGRLPASSFIWTAKGPIPLAAQEFRKKPVPPEQTEEGRKP